MTRTVIEYVLNRLHDIGVDAVFGVPGDFAFPVQDAIVHHPDIAWVGCCNELNAGYAADGYARIRGVAALSTTYGVGELSAINAVAGAFAENLPVFHLTGMPATEVQSARLLVHHTLGTGEFDFFRKMADPVVCASAIMTPHNVAAETERLIAAALYHRRPVYMAFPSDLVNQPVLDSAVALDQPTSDPANLEAAVDAVVAELSDAATACILPGILVARLGLRDGLQRLVNASGLPYATMFADKSVLDEQQPAYVGMYNGTLMDGDVRQLVESSDCVLAVGTLKTDFNTGAFTSRIDPAKLVRVGHHQTEVGGHVFADVELADMLAALTRRLPSRPLTTPVHAGTLGEPVGEADQPVTADALYPRWERFLKEDDIVVSETGTCSMGLAFAKLPRGATFHNQTLWGAIGWATPAALGAALAAPDRRVVLITGEGSHQLTVQEISQFARRGLTPVIFVLNNNGYLIERLLCSDPNIAYNDVAQWNYTELPHALGCDGWFTARVTTCAELDAALATAQQTTVATYIEIVTDTYAAPPLAEQLGANTETLYA